MRTRFASFPLSVPQSTYPLVPRPWAVTTERCSVRITHQLEATTAAAAICSALELAGTGAVLVACLREGEWA